MTNFNFLLNNLSYLSSEDLVGRPMDSTCFRSAPFPLSFRLRLHPLRMVATLLLILCLGVGNVWGTDATVALTTSNTSLSSSGITVNSNIAITFAKGSYKDLPSVNSTYTKIYAGNTITFTPTNATITKVVMTASSNDYIKTWNSTVGSVSVNNKTATWTGSQTSAFTFTNSATAQARITQIAITYTVNDSYTVTWTINPAAGGTLFATSGTSTTVTPNSAYTYGDPAYTVTTGTATVSQSTNTFTATPSANCTIRINMVEKPKYTVTLKDDNSTYTQVSYGASVTLPTRTGCSGYTFAGWTKSWVAEQSSWTTTAPTIIPAGSYTPSANENLYPVYTKTEGGGSVFSQYQKIALNGTITDGKYLISTGSYTMAGDGKTGTSFTPGTTEATDKEYTIATLGSGVFTIKGPDNKYVGGSSGKAVLSFSTSTPSDNNYKWKYNSTGINFQGQTTRYIQANGTTDFRNYAGSGTTTYLYKRIETDGSTTYYISDPDCCTPLGTINGSVNLTQTENTMTVSGWTYDAGATGTIESNVSSYTARLYKWNNSTSDWDIVSGTTSGGASGTQGTRTGISTASKSVTWSGITYDATYKITIQAIGTGDYCDGPETAVTTINGNALTSNQIPWKYSIYIDDGTNSDSGWEHHWINSLSDHSGSVILNSLSASSTYKFKLTLGGVVWYSANATMTSDNCTNWTLYSNVSQTCGITTTISGDYTFSINTGSPSVSVAYPLATQPSGRKIWFDKSVITGWTDEGTSDLCWRIGKTSNSLSNKDETANYFTLVPGTDRFYVYETKEYIGFEAWHIANNVAWTGDSDNNPDYNNHGIYTHYHDQSSTDVTRATVYQKYVVGTEGVTLVPTTKKNTDWYCDFWNVDVTSGMLTHTATITTPSHGTITISNVAQSLSATSTTANLPHRTILTITATPDAGYQLSSLTVNGVAFTSGNTHILTADATIAATFTAQTSTVTLDNNDATSGSQQTVSATYDAAMPLVTTAAGTPAVAALSRTGYTFTGWWDATSGGTQYYSYNAGTSTLSSARTWDKTGAQTLKAQWSINSYTLTWNLGGRGKITTAGTAAPENATGTPHDDIEYNTAISVPVAGSANGYTFTGWSPKPASNMPAENTTYTAQWSANQYTVTLNNHGATTAGTESVTATFDAAMPAITPPEKTGYRFDGYYTLASGGTKYYNADGTSATIMKLYGATPTLHAHWVAQLTFSVNGAIDDELTRDDNTAMPSTAAVPTACGDCWAFMGWSTDPDEDGAPEYAGGATHEFGEPTTLYAVYRKGSTSLYATVPSCPTYTITWMVNGVAYSTGSPTTSTTECAGIETLPTAPSNSTLSCANKFMGWSESTLVGTGLDAPADLFTTAGDAPTIDENKTFYAVFATAEGSETEKTIRINKDTLTSYAAVDKSIGGIAFKSTGKWGAVSWSSYTYVQGENGKVLYNDNAFPGYIKSITITPQSPAGVSNYVQLAVGTTKQPTSYSDNITTTSTTNYTAGNGYTYLAIKANGASALASISITYVKTDYTYSDYVTTCCDKNITLSDPTITDAAGSGATITFDKSSPVATCGGETTVTATLTLPAGYEATALSFSGGSVSVSPEITLPVTTTTVYTLTFDANTNATLTTTATVAAKTANAWNWTYNSGAIPDPLVLYVGINKQLDVTYEPDDLLNTQKNYTVTKESSVAEGAKGYAYYKMRGAAGVTTETNSTVTFSLNGLSQTVNVTVKPQPRVHFVDIVHGETFDPVMPAVELYVANFVRQTPTHADVAEPGTGNDCEKQHLHLIGWIRSDYSKVEDYLDGTGAKPSITELTDAGTDGEGLSYYFETNADINVEAYNGLTFYAVWAKVE